MRAPLAQDVYDHEHYAPDALIEAMRDERLRATAARFGWFKSARDRLADERGEARPAR